MLECQEATKKYMGRTAVDRMSLKVEKGRIYALLGPNGSGKTTLMKMVAGLVKPSEGKILYDKQPVGVESKKKIAYMSTEPFYYNYMTISDVGGYYKDFFKDFDLNKYVSLIKKMKLRMQDKVKSLSSGMAAKLKIAATLSRNAELILLDEPLNGIDIIAREQIISTIVESANEGNALVISSHLVDELEKIIDYAVFMKEGNLVMQGDAEAMREERGMSIVDLYKRIYA